MRNSNRSDLEQLETNESVLEVVVLWGDQSVLHVAHLSPPRTFCVGDALDEHGKLATDFLIGSESLGSERVPITLESASGPVLVVPEGAQVELTRAGERLPQAALVAQAPLLPCPQWPGALQCSLPAATSARMHYRGFTFIVKPTTAARRVGVGGAPRIDWKQSRFTLGSVGFHAALLLLFYFLPPSSAALAIDRLNTDSRLVSYALDQLEIPDEDTPIWLKHAENDSAKTKGGVREQGDEGSMGDAKAPKTRRKYAVAGPAANRDPDLPVETAETLPQNAGIIGVLKAMARDWNNPTSPYGKAAALGNDAEAALGALIGDAYGSNFGEGGLGMLGTGRHGGGTALGTIGQDGLATIGGAFNGDGGTGYIRGTGRLRERGPGTSPQYRVKIDVRGSLSKEVIRRVIHQHLAEVRFCYEQALRSRPDLQGRVAVHFIIAPTGLVQAATTASSDLGSPRVDQCIADTVHRWIFPSPEGGGVVVVTYPFVLQQTGS